MGKIKVSLLKKYPEGRHSDGNNLYLNVTKDSRTWLIRTKVGGRRTWRGLGSVEQISLTQARVLAQLYNTGQIDKKEKVKGPEKVKFKDFYMGAINHIANIKRWSNPKSQRQWVNTVETYALPILGDLDMDRVTVDDIKAVLEPIYYTKTETAVRLCGRLHAIFDYAEVQKIRTKSNPATWNGKLSLLFPSPKKVKPVVHHKAVSLKALPPIIRRLWEIGSVGALSVIFGTITASRVQEFAGADWSEIDWENGVWIMPAERRKDRKGFPHRVPLCPLAIKTLERLPSRIGPMFPGQRGGSICKETPRKVIRDLGFDATMHGMRSLFRDWCALNKKDWAASEKALSHQVGGSVVQAYLRTDMLDKRRPLMDDWAKYCFSLVEL